MAALIPLIAASGRSIERDAALADFAALEAEQQRATPSLRYSELLARVHARLAEKWNTASTAAMDEAFGASVGDWPAFPDSPDALAYLKRHYKLVILSNVDRKSFARTNEKLG